MSPAVRRSNSRPLSRRDLFVLLSSVAPSASVVAPDPESLPPSPISCSGSDPTSSMPSENSIEAQSGHTRVEASATPSVASAQIPNSPASSPRPGHEACSSPDGAPTAGVTWPAVSDSPGVRSEEPPSACVSRTSLPDGPATSSLTGPLDAAGSAAPSAPNALAPRAPKNALCHRDGLPQRPCHPWPHEPQSAAIQHKIAAYRCPLFSGQPLRHVSPEEGRDGT
ncbi:hypothetical protein KOW79_007576 [Hemibagrus wyckioides]|uniref:Uncharacterized protein n=1 Tax=Hemibagrus wyckioides TaxID=337641 RepID=A0A9D3NYU4_9TELE|nr:hypothetical protein KOW79_007576 [Hemibagrus wyckioides]